jgi:hypothetical protein
MRSGQALRSALRDLYENSWRFVPANAALGLVLVMVGVSALMVPLALVALVLAGPLLAALVHMAVTLVRTGDVELRDGLEGLGLHWRRGLGLMACGTALALLAAVALRFYTRLTLGWPLAFLVLYLSVLLAVYLALAFMFAIASPASPVRAALRSAGELFAARPGATLLLALALLVVNLIGVAAALMPFLTVTVAYSILAVVRFALPLPDAEEGA